MRVNLKTLGCRLNEAELESWAQKFQQKGHQVDKAVDEADLVVLNTCAVTGEAVRKSRQSIRRIYRDSPTAKLVVSGCYASLKPEEVAESLGVDLVVLNQDKERLVELAETELDLKSMPQLSSEPGEVALFSRGRQRAFVKVQDGCRYRCTFCIVTHARGAEKSRTICDIVDEIYNLHAQGIQEVILTGVHLGGYGSDIEQNLSALIEAVLSKTTLPRLRLGSLEPWDLPEGFFQLFKNSRLMPHLHLPLQSGSDTVLKRMARRCKTAEFRQIVDEARKIVPNINITTDIIVGFPGETEIEWQESFDFIKQIAFGHIHIFTYSPREGTKASTLPNQLTQIVKKERSQKLHQLTGEMKQAFFKQQIGREEAILWEGNLDNIGSGTAIIYGYTPNYTRVSTTAHDAAKLVNSIQIARLDTVDIEGGNIQSTVKHSSTFQ